ncbi:monophosphate-protein transferase FICD homolog [Seminavis robusta]|uniref:Monophosphate-protein transferase FICD homolog n=1 Tax=Seminavis robusta TaxID=568900 RepID=A0A9N8EUD0_9STRA|nr:monophosphate-protein transferase FICD homolog [Seminavis robusta]|eukprot:Sro2206_g319000.1 monophosphate-protein transferase FICD homolog (346) ;mRNA; f:4645-5682
MITLQENENPSEALTTPSSGDDYVGGVAGVGTCLAAFFGLRVDWLRRQREKLRKQHEETVEYIQNEITKVYNGTIDPFGRILSNYCKLFELRATAHDKDVDAFNQKLMKLGVGRRAAGLRMPDLLMKLKIDMTYNSNAIEGNPISYTETAIILSGFVGPRRRSIRDVHDIVGHAAAFDEVQKSAAVGNSQISIDEVKLVHRLVLFGSEDGGVFQKEEEIAVITATKVLLAMPDETEALVQRLLIWLSKNSNVHPFVLAVTFHYIFVRIHPFRDGNGRTARLLSNLVLMQHGYPLIVVPLGAKTQYMTSLRQWNKGDPGPFTSLMANLLHKSFDLYFSSLKISGTK